MSHLLKRYVNRVNSYFFNVGSSFDLGVNRILFYGWLFYARHDPLHFARFSALPASLWDPVTLFSMVETPIFSFSIALILNKLLLFFIFTSSVGFFTRSSTFVVALLYFVLVGSVQSFGYPTPDDLPLVLVALIFPFCSCGDSLSIDAVIRRWLAKQVSTKDVSNVRANPQTSDMYQWPIKLVQILFCLVFWSAGLSKLRNAGLNWITTDTVRNMILVAHTYRNDFLEPTRGMIFPIFIARYALMCKILATFTLALELVAPLALFVKRTTIPILLGLALAQISIYFLLFVNFKTFVALYFFWIPWEKLVNSQKLPENKT